MIDYNRGLPAAECSVTPLQDTLNFYSSFDNILSLLVDNIPFGAMLQGYGQRALAPVAWVVPELSAAFDTYVDTFITSPEMEGRVGAVLDALPLGTLQHGYDLLSQLVAYLFWV